MYATGGKYYSELDRNVAANATYLQAPLFTSFRAMEQTAARSPAPKLLALTTSPPDHGDIARSVASGAAGFVDAEADPDDVAAAVRAVHGGGVWIP